MILIEKAETAKCPDCGSKYLVNTGYCMSCKKKVAEPKKDEKKETKKENYDKAIADLHEFIVNRKKTRKINENEVMVAEPDWDYLETKIERIGSIDLFDNVRSGDELSMKQVLQAMEDMNFDSAIDEETIFELVGLLKRNAVNSVIEREGLDYSEIASAFGDELIDLEMAMESNINYNYDDLMPNDIFMYDEEEIELPDMMDLYDEDGEFVDEVKEFIDYAVKEGFKERDALDVISNATYGGMSGVGIIVSGADLATAIMKSDTELTGDMILYIRDSYNGGGHYIISNKTKTIKYGKNWVKKVDSGRMSLGEVFGTSDWTYR